MLDLRLKGPFAGPRRARQQTSSRNGDSSLLTSSAVAANVMQAGGNADIQAKASMRGRAPDVVRDAGRDGRVFAVVDGLLHWRSRRVRVGIARRRYDAFRRHPTAVAAELLGQ